MTEGGCVMQAEQKNETIVGVRAKLDECVAALDRVVTDKAAPMAEREYAARLQAVLRAVV
jgi:hypothetical protein